MVPVFEKTHREINSEHRLGDSVSSQKEPNYRKCKYNFIENPLFSLSSTIHYPRTNEHASGGGAKFDIKININGVKLLNLKKKKNNNNRIMVTSMNY